MVIAWGLSTPCGRYAFSECKNETARTVKQFLIEGATEVRAHHAGYHLATFTPSEGVDGPDSSVKCISSKVMPCLATIQKLVYHGG